VARLEDRLFQQLAPIAEGVLGARQRARIEATLPDDAAWAANGKALARVAGLTGAALMLAIILIMVMLGLGLY